MKRSSQMTSTTPTEPDRPFFVGFENTAASAANARRKGGSNYPPYNIERTGDDGIRITIAVAGFGEDDLSFSVDNGQLIVSGKKETEDSTDYIYQGIAARQFVRAFVIAEGIVIDDVILDNGLLLIELKREKQAEEIQKHESPVQNNVIEFETT